MPLLEKEYRNAARRLEDTQDELTDLHPDKCAVTSLHAHVRALHVKRKSSVQGAHVRLLGMAVCPCLHVGSQRHERWRMQGLQLFNPRYMRCTCPYNSQQQHLGQPAAVGCCKPCKRVQP